MPLTKTELVAASQYHISEAEYLAGKQTWLRNHKVTESQAFALTQEDSEVIAKLGQDPEGFLQNKRQEIELEMAEVGHDLANYS